MSIKVMTHVWEHSQQKGSYLVTMLAIADYAHDDGTGAYPSIATLAKKTRMTDRNVQLVLRKLEEDRELVIHLGAGPRGCNSYSIPLNRPATKPPDGGGEKISGGEALPPGGGEKSCAEGVKPVSPNPLRDPSDLKTDPGISLSSMKQEKKEEPVKPVNTLSSHWKKEHTPDGSWNKGPVQLPDVDRPDEFLATLGFHPGEPDYESLYAVAEAELEAEGNNPFYTIRPIKQARMIAILLRDGVIPTETAAAD